MKKHFHHWYAGEVNKKLRDTGNDNNKVIDLKLIRLKPFGLQWLVDACSYIEHNDLIQNGFSEAGITAKLSPYI